MTHFGLALFVSHHRHYGTLQQDYVRASYDLPISHKIAMNIEDGEKLIHLVI